MKFLSWFVLLPLSLITIILAANNRDPVTIELWLLPFDFAPPLWLLLMVFAAIGFLAGLAVGLNKSMRWRARARRAEAEAARLEGELRHSRDGGMDAAPNTGTGEMARLSGPPARAA